MTHRPDRRRFLAAALAGAAAPAAFAQDARGLQPGERAVDPAELPLDRPGVWTLHFRYKPLRIMTLDGFDARGNPARQVVWYLWYEVYNRSGEPVFFTPTFELVTRNPPTTHLDEPQPFIFEQVKRFEDRTITPASPNGIQNLQSTIQISRRPIPPSLPDAFPRRIAGLAVWTDVAPRVEQMAREAGGQLGQRVAQFSVYVTGLSNGVATEQTPPVGPGGEVITQIKRKTLRLDFFRAADDNRPEATDIRADTTNGPAETWLYRASARGRNPDAPAVPPKKDMN